ncbi:unnamed protein product [Cunninghamella blakesleeana]
MVSVNLKLYEILNNDSELWNRARLVYYCSIYFHKPILPSFAAQHEPFFTRGEIDNASFCHKMTIALLPNLKTRTNRNHHKKEIGSIFKQNLISIQFNKQKYSFSIKADKYFDFNSSSMFAYFFVQEGEEEDEEDEFMFSEVKSMLSKEELSSYLLEDNEYLKLIYIPFFIYDILEKEEDHPFLLDEKSVPYLSGILLLGNMNINRWISFPLWKHLRFDKPSLCSADDYIFNIY